MKTYLRSLLTAGFAAACVLPASAKIERTVEKSFSVQPGGTLTVSTQGGNIHVQSSNDSVVRVTATQSVRVNTEAEADEILKNVTLTFEQNGNDVTAKSTYERPSALRFRSSPSVSVSFHVTVPLRYSTDLETSGGNIVISDLDGAVRARTSGGDIKLATISGEITANTSGGNVSLVEGGRSVKLSTSGGNITVGRSLGAADLHTSGGDIKIDLVREALSARTSGGDVRATIAGELKGDCVLSTSGGTVRVNVDKSSKFDLDASTSGGGVHAEGITITIAKGGHGRSSLAGAVNGGGAKLKLRSSGGDIRLAVN